MSENSPSLRIATYNVHKCRGLDRRVDARRIGTVLREIDADVIALQEVAWPTDAGYGQHQARYLAEHLGFHYRVGETRRWRKRVFGNAVLSRFPIIAEYRYDLTHGRYERRGCLRSDILVPGNRLVHVFNVHLALIPKDRRVQGLTLMSDKYLLSPELSGPRIVLGDFNEGPSGVVSQFLRPRFQSVDIHHRWRRIKTYPGILPLLHLDHIYFDARLRVETAHRHRSPTALIASDHAPIVAEFSFARD